jgi:hypothetical protein
LQRILLTLLILCKALTAVDRTVIAWPERNSGFLAALCTRGRKHLTIAPACVFARITATFAPLWFVREAFFRIKLLLTRRKNEFCSAVSAL